MFEFINDIINYETRKIARDTTNSGLEVSTVYTSDEGYETALIDKNGVHPVERYPEKRDAEKGHNKWLDFSNNYLEGQEVTELGGLDGLCEDRQIVLSI